MARLIDQVLGHEDTWRQLLSARGHLPHALAFTGPSGIGKRKVAWALAQALLCTAADEAERPCGHCGPCLRTEKQQSESVLYIEPQGAQIKLEAAQQVQEFLSLGRMSQARLILINEAQLLNPQAANALLKRIEEPPPSTHFILLTPEISQLLPTLRSRSQVVRFRPLPETLLQQGEDIPAWRLKSARGSFEKLASFQDEDITALRSTVFTFLAEALAQNRSGLQALLEQTKERESALQAVRFLQQGLRDWTVMGQALPIHGDFQWQELPAAPAHRKADLWRYSQQMENDLQGHVDRTLIFENFFYRSGHVLD